MNSEEVWALHKMETKVTYGGRRKGRGEATDVVRVCRQGEASLDRLLGWRSPVEGTTSLQGGGGRGSYRRWRGAWLGSSLWRQGTQLAPDNDMFLFLFVKSVEQGGWRRCVICACRVWKRDERLTKWAAGTAGWNGGVPFFVLTHGSHSSKM